MFTVIGRTLSHYKIQEELSRGGMGVVYRALDTKLDRDVALKVLPPELVADEVRLRRFVQEAKAAASIHHPHIATIHEIDDADGVYFIAMELIDGEKLSDVVARGPVPVSRVLELAMEMAEGLSKAHEKRVVHRDLKPANMMVTEDGHIASWESDRVHFWKPRLSGSLKQPSEHRNVLHLDRHRRRRGAYACHRWRSSRFWTGVVA